MRTMRTRHHQPIRRYESDSTLYCNFDAVATVNVWIRHQKRNLQLRRVMFTMMSQMLLFILESIFLLGLLICLLTHEEESMTEFYCTILVWLFTNLIAIFLKAYHQRVSNISAAFCSNQIGGFWNAVLLLLKPFKYMRAIYHRRQKNTVLGKEFVHGETVNAEQFNLVMHINLEEFTDARDDLHDAFLVRLPMAFLQFYFFYQSHNADLICTAAYAFRFFVVLLSLISTILSCLEYEWKREVYIDTLHLHGYMTTNGRYWIPRWIENNIIRWVKILILVTCLMSRFFLVSFAAQVSWGHGLACLLILFFFTWVIIALGPTMRATLENLPSGIPTWPSYVTLLWCATFSGLCTRFQRLSRTTIRSCTSSYRLPYHLTQFIPFLLSFLLIFCFIELMLASGGHKRQEALQHANETMNSTICDDYEEWPTMAKLTNTPIWSILDVFNIVSDDPGHKFKNFLYAHWMLFFIHIFANIAYTYYTSKEGDEDDKDDFFPPTVCYAVFKRIFQKIYSIENVSIQIKLLARFLFLISIDLETFNNLHNTISRMDDADSVNSSRWWSDKIISVVERHDPCNTRYRNYSNGEPDFRGVPIEVEIQAAYGTIQHLNYSYRLYLMCGFSIDTCVLKEMSSHRLEATLEMLQFSKKDLLIMLNDNQ